MLDRLATFARRTYDAAYDAAGRLIGVGGPPRRDRVVSGLGTAPYALPVPPQQLDDDPPPRPTKTQRNHEYAAAQIGLAAYYRSLPTYIDDLTQGLGDDLYSKMYLDDQVFTSTRNFVRQVLSDGLTLRPAVDAKKGAGLSSKGAKEQPGYQQSKDILDRALAMLDALPQSLDEILQEMLIQSAGMGHKVAELVCAPDDDGYTAVARIKPKPRRSTAFVVNPYNDLVGMLVRLPGMALPALASVTDLRSLPILPVDKFAVLTHMQENCDPRGHSLWRAAYERWFEKLQAAREYMKWLGQWASPSLVGVLPESDFDEPATDAFANPVATAPNETDAQRFLNQIILFRNGSCIVIPHGADLKPLFVTGEGQAFLNKIDACDRQIDKVITGQVLAGQEAKHSGLGSGKGAEVHQDTGGGNLPYYRGLAERMLQRQILQRWVRLNWGPEAARTLTPLPTLKKIEAQDRGALMASYGALYTSGVLKPSQLPFVHEELGLPPCTPDELKPPEPAAPPAGGAAAPGGKPKPKPKPGNAGFAADPHGAIESRLAELAPRAEASFEKNPDEPRVPAGSPHGGEWTAGGAAKTAEKEGKSGTKDAPPASKKGEKPRAARGEMAPAKREGKGKEARLVMADGSPVPAHVPAGKIPPGWTDVKVSVDPQAEVLATGKDAKGRPTTLYRDDFHMKGAAVKFARTREGLAKRKEMYAENQQNRADPKTREAADVVWLMQEQGTRPGSDEETGGKVKAYGATTLEGRHVIEDEGGRVHLQFVGKEGVYHQHRIDNPELAKMLLERSAKAGAHGKLFAANYAKVAAYTKTLDGGRFTPKDLRTQRANVLAIKEIARTAAPKTVKEYKAAVKAVAEKVSSVLGNRPTQAIESYIDPSVFAPWRIAANA